MKCLVKVDSRNYDLNGDMILGLKISDFQDKCEAKGLSTDKEYILELTEKGNKRTKDQNKYFWKLVGLISKKLGQTDNETYLTILKGANAKSEYVQLLPQALPILKKDYKAIELIENRGDSNLYRVYYGTSQMTKEEFNYVLEETFRICAELNIRYELEAN